MDNVFQNINVSILLLLVIIVAQIFFNWLLNRDKQHKLKLSVDDYNNLLSQLHELQNENQKLKKRIEKTLDNSENNQKKIVQVKSINNENRVLFNGNHSELINEFRKGNSKKVFQLLIDSLNSDSDEFYEALNIESKWRTIQDFKIEGTVDASSLILEETKIGKSTLLLIQKIKNAAPNNA